jgi:lysophospholipid acyltransferase
LRLEGDYKTIQYQHAPWLRNFAKATAFALAEVFVRPHCDESIFETWGEYSLLQRNLILYPIAICMRFRYYTAFKFTQAGIDALAITYQDGGYERFSVADYRYELEPSGIQKTNMWNSLVQLWLKNCLYER